MRIPTLALASCTALVLFGGGLVAQDAALRRAREALRAGRPAQAHELAEKALAIGGESADWLLLRAKALHGLGQVEAARACRDQLARIHRQRLRDLDRLLAGKSASARDPAAAANDGSKSKVLAGSSAPPTAPSMSPKGKSVEEKSPEEIDAAAAATRVALRQQLRSEDAGARAAAATELRKQYRVATRRILADVGRGKHKRSLGRVGNLFTEARMRARQRDVAPGEGLVEELLGPLLDLIARQVLAHMDDEDPAIADGYAEQLGDGVALMVEIEAERRAIAALDVLINVERLSARGLGALSESLEAWAASIEGMQFASEEQRLARANRLVQLGQRLQARGATRLAGEDLLVQLRKSKSEGLRQRVQKILVSWAKARESAGDAAVARGDAGAAAREFERAYFCEPSLMQVLARAAEQFERAEQLGDASRAHAVLAQGLGKLSDNSVAWLDAQWRVASKRLPEVGIDPSAAVAIHKLPRQLDELTAFVDRIEQHMPVLAARELASLRIQIEQRDGNGAQRALQKLLEALRSGAKPQWRGATLGAQAPKVGENFHLPTVSASCAWVEGTADEPGFWRFEGAVKKEHWDRALSASVRWDVFDQGGWIELSAKNAERICAEIQRAEAKQQRLPAGYRYRLPTMRQVERMRDAQNRLPGVPCEWIWTRDNGEGLGERGAPMRRTALVATEGFRDRDLWQGLVGVGFVIVLTRD